MFDYRQLFGLATVLFAVGFILQSIMPAGANPSGPSISFGSNPYKSMYVTSAGTLFSTSSSETFIITTLMTKTASNCMFQINGAQAFDNEWTYNNHSYSINSAALGNLHYVVEPNSTLSISGGACSNGFYIEGYYVQS